MISDAFEMGIECIRMGSNASGGAWLGVGVGVPVHERERDTRERDARHEGPGPARHPAAGACLAWLWIGSCLLAWLLAFRDPAFGWGGG